MIQRAATEVRARRRPDAVIVVFLFELALGLLIATPVHAWAERVWGAHPRGDAVLWDPGAGSLLSWLGQGDAAIGVAARTTAVLVLVSALVMQLPLGALVLAITFDRDAESRRGIALGQAMRVALTTWLPLLGLLVVGAICTGLVVGAGAMAAAQLDHALVDRLGDARSFAVRIAVLVFFALVAALVGVVLDLARVAAVLEVGRSEPGQREMGTTRASVLRIILNALGAAIRVGGRGVARAMLEWIWRAVLALAALGVGAAIAHALGGRGGATLVGLFLVHQTVVALRVALRASWLARAVAIVGRANDRRNADDRAIAR